jgi:hypothetical protein
MFPQIIDKLDSKTLHLAIKGLLILGGMVALGWLLICWNEPIAAAEVLKTVVEH